MKILVPVRRVPNPDIKVNIKNDGSGIETEGVNYLVNPFDEYAIEEAVQIIEKGEGEIVLVSIGGDNCEETLRAGLALGGTRALLVECTETVDSYAVSDLLAAVAKDENPDLIIVGKQSVDTDNNQAAQMLAAKLDLPQACFAFNVAISSDGRAIVEREIDGGLEVKEVTLPEVITADLRLNQPRYAALPQIMKAKRKELKKVTPAELGVEVRSATRLLGLTEPEARAAGQIVTSVEELVNKLQNEAKVLLGW
jgi:electron transfer flavoprotein beta subunit